MSKSKAVLLSLSALVIAAAISVGVVGCAKSQPAAVTPQPFTSTTQPSATAPSTNGAQPGQPNGSQRQFNSQQMQANIKTALASLVSNGTITQAQANQVVQAYANRQPSSSPRPASGQRQSPILTQMVSNGTLTQTQATAVNQAIRQVMPHRTSGVSTSGLTTTTQ